MNYYNNYLQLKTFIFIQNNIFYTQQLELEYSALYFTFNHNRSTEDST